MALKHPLLSCSMTIPIIGWLDFPSLSWLSRLSWTFLCMVLTPQVWLTFPNQLYPTRPAATACAFLVTTTEVQTQPLACDKYKLKHKYKLSKMHRFSKLGSRDFCEILFHWSLVVVEASSGWWPFKPFWLKYFDPTIKERKLNRTRVS